MEDTLCVQFLQWVTPFVRMRWQGFRRVRKQVCKRVQRRIDCLGLEGVEAYRRYLQANPKEWELLDGLLRVVVTRFYRDRKVFDALYLSVLPQRINEIRDIGGTVLRVWCIGCASGEEPYSLALLWHHLPPQTRQGMELKLLATDSDAYLLQRARNACYPFGTIKALPGAWQEIDFEQRAGEYCLHDEISQTVEFKPHDVRQPFTYGRFELLFCRNLVFTYFEESLQMEILKNLHAALQTAGLLVIGARETLPAGQGYFERLQGCRGLYRRRP